MFLAVVAVRVVCTTWKAFVIYAVGHKEGVIELASCSGTRDDGKQVFQPTWQGKDRQSNFHLLQLSPVMLHQSGTDVKLRPSIHLTSTRREKRRRRNANNESCQIRLQSTPDNGRERRL